MEKTFRLVGAVISVCASGLAMSQGGAMGGGGFGGGQQGERDNYANFARAINEKISRYLNGEDVRSILTPGEVTEWTLEMKTDQVVVAEAWSDVFDAALEVADDQGKAVAFNDDRWVGDQRPLLLWRCEKAGTYSLRAKCFQNKAGGPVNVRYKVYDSYMLSSDNWLEHEIEGDGGGKEFLLRIPLKKNEMVQLAQERRDKDKNVWASLLAAISPSGLPDANLLGDFDKAFTAPIRAAVPGDYYVLAQTSSQGKRSIRMRALPITDKALAWAGKELTDQALANKVNLWSFSVKKGEIIEVTAAELNPATQILTRPAPKDWVIDPKKPETNPFGPASAVAAQKEGPAFEELPGRDRDGRVMVFRALRDTQVFSAVIPGLPATGNYTYRIEKADRDFGADAAQKATLRIGANDYWSFDAKVGDVMDLTSDFQGYSQEVTVLDPGGNEFGHYFVPPDSYTMKETMFFETPGRYIVRVTSNGGGGGGSYSLSRHVLPAKEFGKGKPATGDLSDGKIHIWKFTAKPGEPLWIHWTSSDWSYGFTVRDGEGRLTSLPMTVVDQSQRYGILTVDKPRDYLIVLMPNGSKAKYSIEIGDIPGYKKGE